MREGGLCKKKGKKGEGNNRSPLKISGPDCIRRAYLMLSNLRLEEKGEGKDAKRRKEKRGVGYGTVRSCIQIFAPL